MTDSPLATAHRLLDEATAALATAAGAGASDDELLSALTICEGVTRQLDRLTVATIAALDRRGTFADRGYKSTTGALGDLLGWERFEARRRVVAAEQVGERVGLDGAVLPARLPATAAVFATGRAGLRHVEVIAKVLAGPAAARLAPEVWAGAEDELADKATVYTPSELHAWGDAPSRTSPPARSCREPQCRGAQPVPLRTTTRPNDTGETFGAPTQRTSLQEIERQLCLLSRRENRPGLYRQLADRAGVTLSPRACWLLCRPPSVLVYAGWCRRSTATPRPPARPAARPARP